MANRLFQGIIHQMTDAVDRTLGVIDETGTVIACSELVKIGETRQEALKVLQKLYYSELLSYLSGHYFASKQYNQEAYQEVKNTILSLKLDKEYPFQPLFDIVECYAKGDMRAHFELVKSKKKEMAEKDFELILLNVTRLYPNSPELIPDVISYIRSSLPELKAANIMMMGQILMQLEKK